jgi:hypothetical protein
MLCLRFEKRYAAGYVYTDMAHFTLPVDAQTHAQVNGQSHRKPQD